MCTLRAFGADFDPDEFLRKSPFKACRVFRRGEPRLAGSRSDRLSRSSGFNVPVTADSLSDLSSQIAAAERFVSANCLELARLAEYPGVSTLILDFGLAIAQDLEPCSAGE